MIGRIAGLTAATALALGAATHTAAQDLNATLSRAADLSGFAEGLAATDLEPEGPVTIFAPTDEAFLDLPEQLRDQLRESPETLRYLLRAHVAAGGRHETDDLPVEMSTLSGNRLLVTYTQGALTVRLAQPEATVDPEAVMRARAANEARVVAGNLRADDAIVHAIDAVLLPLDLDEMLERADRQTSAETTDGRDETAQEASSGYAEQIAESAGVAEVQATGTETETYTVEVENPRTDPATEVPQTGGTVTVPSIVLTQGATDDDLPSQDERREQRQQSGQGPPEAGSNTVDDATTSATAMEGLDLTAETVSISALLERPVRDGAGTELGTVSDLMMSLETARVETLVYDAENGLFGLGSTQESVDIREVAIDPLDGAIIVPSQATGGDETEPGGQGD